MPQKDLCYLADKELLASEQKIKLATNEHEISRII
jgi:hypothetical protein